MATEDIDVDAEDPQERPSADAFARPVEVEEAIEELKLCRAAEGEQRDLEEDDLAFDAGEQWPEEVASARRAQTVNGIEIPGRPMLTIPKLDQPVQLVINQQRRSHLGISVHPENETANKATADALAGLMRYIQRNSNAETARNWAFERAVKAGRGYYRVLARYVDVKGDGDHWSDQELFIKRIKYQSSVFIDPYAEEADKSDAMWAQLGGFISWKEHKRRWPDSHVSKNVLTGDDFDIDQSMMEPDWMSAESATTGLGAGLRGVRVMERFKVVERSRFRVAYRDAKNSDRLIDEYVEGDAKARTAFVKQLGERVRAQREVIDRTVKWMKLNSCEILEEEEWPGYWIPVFVVQGREQVFKNQTRVVGMIRPAKDGARLFNYAATAAVEKEALDTKAPYIGYEGQFKGHEQAWSQSATKNFPYLQVAPVTIGGQPAPFPVRNTATPNLMGSLSLLEAADNFIKAVTFTYDPSLGAQSGSDSGRKVLALQQQSDQGNSHYLDNMATDTMPHESRVLLDLIPHFYDRPGRVAQILGDNDDRSEIILNAPFIPGPDGRPRPLTNANPQLMPKGVKHYDLTKGRYSVVCSVGKNYQSRLQEGSDEMGKVLEAAPDLLKVIGDIYFRFRDFPGHMEISERLKKMLPPQLLDDPNAEDNPEALKAKLAAQQQAMQELEQAFNEAMKDLETQRVQAEAKIQSEALRAESAERLQLMKIQGEQMLAEIQANLTARIKEIELASEQRSTQVKVAGDLAKAEGQGAIDAREQARDHAHDVEMAVLEHQLEMHGAEMEHAHEMDAQVEDERHETAERRESEQHERIEAGADRIHEATEAEKQAKRDRATPKTDS